MIRCAMFDFGNVLVRFDTKEFYDFLRAHQIQVSGAKELKEMFSLKAISDFDLGKIDVRGMFQGIKRELALDVAIEEFLFQYTNVMKPDPKMAMIRQALQRNGIKAAVVSNINSYHYSYVSSVYPGVFAGFDYLMLSFQHGFKKPDKRMWEIPASELGVLSGECFFVDDMKSNIESFNQWSGGLGVGHLYDVVDENFISNNQLELERNKLVGKMVGLRMISPEQGIDILKNRL